MIITRTIASLLFASLLFGIVLISPTKTSSQIRRETPKTSEQNLTGEKAVDELKRSGGYESLNEAFRKASGMNLSDPEPANLLPSGTYEEVGLDVPLGSGDKAIGTSVALDRDTAVIGARWDDNTLMDQGAVYVFVRSGNTWTEQQRLLAPDPGVSDYLGISVSISGDTIVAGASGDDIDFSNQGSAYIFVRSGASWSLEQKITSDGGRFGSGVAIDRDTIVVGIPDRDSPTNIYDYDVGAADVFTRSGTTWTKQTRLYASDYQPYDYFGEQVAISGNTIVVSSAFEDAGSGNTDDGAAYVFTGSGSSWTQQAKLTASTRVANDFFGYALSIDGDTLAVGAAYRDNTHGDQGAVFVFVRSGSSWTQQQMLVASDPSTSDLFGYSVSLKGEYIVVGAPYDDGPGGTDQGSAYLFKRTGASWSQETKFVGSDSIGGDDFGRSVALHGDTVLIGSPLDDVGGRSNHGSAKIFQTKVSISKVVASDGASSDYFGFVVAVSGQTAVVGAPYDDILSASDRGSAYVFSRIGYTWTQQAKLVADDGAANDLFGFAVAISDDTIVVGARGDDILSAGDQGSAYIFIRTGSSWTQQRKLTASDGQAGDLFGWSVAISGDEVLVGALGDDSFRGAAYVFNRSGGTWPQQAKLLGSDGAASDQFGFSVGISSNHAVVGSYEADVGANTNQGAAYVFSKSSGLWSQEAKLVSSDGAATDQFGYSVAISGNTVVVSAVTDDVFANDQGSAYVFTRSGATWSQQAKLVASDGEENDQFGSGVAISGDTIVVGAIADDIALNSDQGSAYIFTRSGTVWSQQRKLLASDGASSDYFGVRVAVSGQTVIVGADWDDIGANFEQGSAHIYHWGPLRVTAGGSNLSGRVLETNGRGLANATVILTDSTGVERTVQTGSFGRFSFSDLPSGETYIVSVRSRRFVFAPQVVNLQSDLSDMRLEASGKSGR